MTPLKNIAILGGSGIVGVSIVTALLEHGFNVTAIARESSKATFPSGVNVVRVPDSFTRQDLKQAFTGQDAVVSAFNPDLVGRQIDAIDAAIDAGVRRFIPSEWGVDHRQTRVVTELGSIFAKKLPVLNYLKKNESKISWTAVPTGPMLDWDLLHFGGNLLGIKPTERTALLIDDGTSRFSVSTMSQVGQWVAAVLNHPEETANRFAPLESFEISQVELLAAVEKALGGSKFAVAHRDGKELTETSLKLEGKSDLQVPVGLIQVSLLTGNYGQSFHDEAKAGMAKFGVEQLDLQSEVDRALKVLGLLN